MKAKAVISCIFVFTYAKSRFSPDMAHIQIVPVAIETESEKVESYEDWNEEVEVKKFLHDNLTNYGLMILMRDYLFRVVKFEKCKW